MKKYIDEILRKKYIKSNIFFYVISILIVKKFNNRLRFYVNYRAFNIFIIFNRNISSLIKNILTKFCNARIYNKFNIIATFNKIRIKKRHEKKTAFFIRYNLYKYKVILFKLYNTPVIFQTFINDVLKEYLNVFCTAYLDDIFIYNNIKKKYIYYIKKILKKLQKTELYLNINKYDFYIKRIKYFGLIIIIDKMEINPKKSKLSRNKKNLIALKTYKFF